MKNLILTIDPGTRYWGVTVFHGTEIITCMIKNLSAKDSSRNRLQGVRKLFSNLCRTYVPNILVIEKPYDFWGHQSQHLEDVIREIKRLSLKEHIKIIEFTPKAIRRVLCNNENATKNHIDEMIHRAYPELKTFLKQRLKHKDGYWRHMSDSISLGICYLMNGITTK